MASLDSLPPDQRAVIQLVLQQRRSYDDIAGLLVIDRAGVRQRALDAFDALGPSNSIPAPQRALLTDYLLGQLPGRLSDQVRDGIAGSPGERAWLRVIASEVGALASEGLPEIPAAGSRAVATSSSAGAERAGSPAAGPGAAGVDAARIAADGVAARPPAGEGRRQAGRSRTARTAAVAPGVSPAPASEPRRPSSGTGPAGPASSRRGGAIVLGLGALLIVAVVVVVLLVTGGGNATHHNLADRSTSSTPATSTPTTSTTSSTSKAKFVTQVNLNSPTGNKNRKGVAQVLSEGTTLGVLLLAENVPPNTKTNAYAVWLSNSSTDNRLVGFVNSRVSSNGKLETEGPLPSDASHYKEMLVTLETQQKPKTPGPVVLEGALKFP